jgi:hypothetical protein
VFCNDNTDDQTPIVASQRPQAGEVRRALESLGHRKISDKDFGSVMAALDADGSGEVCLDEFLSVRIRNDDKSSTVQYRTCIL